MAFEKIKADFHKLSERRSDLLKQKKKCENDILSISERLEELTKTGDDSQEFVDQYSKAKDKRRRLRDEVADLEHDARMVEAEITAIMLEYQFVVDFEEINKNE